MKIFCNVNIKNIICEDSNMLNNLHRRILVKAPPYRGHLKLGIVRYKQLMALKFDS